MGRSQLAEVAFDIETFALSPGVSLLDPTVSGVRMLTAYGFDPALGRVSTVFDIVDYPSEYDMLATFASLVGSLSAGTLLVGWNSSSFDLPFIASRFAEAEASELSPVLVPMARDGTHGEPAFSGVWQGATTDDVAFAFEDVAVRLGVRWGLKPVAAALGLAPVVLDAGHPELYSDDEMRTYGLSDARVTYELSALRRDPALLEARIETFLTSESA